MNSLNPERIEYVDLTASDPPLRNDFADIKVEYEGKGPEEVLTELVAAIDAPESVRAAYASETMALFDIGLPDRDQAMHESALGDRLRILDTYKVAVNDAYTQQTFTPGRKGMRKTDSGFRQYTVDDHRGGVEHIEKHLGLGLRGCLGVRPALAGLQILYYAESAAVWDIEEETDALLTEADLALLYRDGDQPDAPTIADVAAKIRSLGTIDLSKETLDKRFNTFVGLTNIDLSVRVLAELSEWALLNIANDKRAIKVATENQGILLSDNLLAKQELLYGLGDKLKNYLTPSTPKLLRRIVGLFGARARSVAQNTDEFLWFFRNVYTSLGYDLPAILQDEEQESTVHALPGVVQTAASTSVRQVVAVEELTVTEEIEPTASPEVIEEISTLKTELSGRIEEADRPWRLSKKRQRELGLDEMQSALRAGARTEATVEGMGNWTPLAPMTADRAALLLGTLVRIEEVGQRQGREAVQKLLERATEEHHTLIDAAEILGAYADSEHHKTYSRPNRPYNPAEDLQYVADYWHIFGDLLQTAGPQNFGGNVWQHLPEPRPTSPYAALLREYRSYAQNAEPITPI
jgi:hypothetical protein